MKFWFTYFLICFNIIYLNAQTPCASAPCRAPSECENLGFDYVCHCKTGIKGKNCDRLMLTGDSPCLNSPCWNNGTCEQVSSTDYKCTCRAGFSGKDCRTIQSTPCSTNNPCQNNGLCQSISQNGVPQPVCFCYGDWTGQYCDTKLGFCDKPNPCFNGGVCVQNYCKCPQNYTGTFCESFDPQASDKILRVLNKGFFVTKLTLYYEVSNGVNKDLVTQIGSILIGQYKIFKIPNSVNYAGDYGVNLILDVVGSFKKISVRINSSPECIDLWGPSFSPKWSKVDC